MKGWFKLWVRRRRNSLHRSLVRARFGLKQPILHHTLSIWVQPSETSAGAGRAKRVEVRVTSVVLLFILGASLVYGTSNALIDYASILEEHSIAQGQLEDMSDSQQRLFARNAVLEAELKTLSLMRLHSDDFNAAVHMKLLELATVIEGSTSIEMLGGSGKAQNGGSERVAAGGLEISCGKGSACDPSARASLDPAKLVVGEIQPQDELLPLLDSTLALLKSVPIGVPSFEGRITSGFGLRKSPFGSGVKMHKGIDIAMRTGNRVRTTGRGHVVSVKTTKTYGLLVDVEHAPGLVTRYAHLSRVRVREKDEVNRGQVLGYAGSSGRSTGPHLHYEVRLNGRAIDPIRFMHLASSLREVL